MALFAVSYDLHNQRNYAPVHAALTEHGGAKLLESLWLIELSNTASQVRDWLKEQVDGDDSVAVVELKSGSGWAGLRSRDAGVKWLREHLKA